MLAIRVRGYGHEVIRTMNAQAKAYIGTSGWNYPHWKGVFYPSAVKQQQWLCHFAQFFNSVELNNSFYRIPSREMVERWRDQTPYGFRFAIKLWRGITHYHKLSRCHTYLSNFFDAISALPTRQRGPLLVQLPPNQGRDLPRLDAFLDDVRQVVAPARWKVTVEFRNDDWLCPDLYRLLDRQRAAICLHDMAGHAAATRPNDSSFVYVRRHGPIGDYSGGYTARQIQSDARRIRQWLTAGKTVFVYYNNDIQGHAVRNATQLRDLINAP